MFQQSHFFSLHNDAKIINGVFHEHWFCFDQPLTLVDTRTFIAQSGETFRSNIPLVFYETPTSDADTPPGSMRIIPQAKILALLLTTKVKQNCCQSQVPKCMLEHARMLQV